MHDQLSVGYLFPTALNLKFTPWLHIVRMVPSKLMNTMVNQRVHGGAVVTMD